MAVGDGVILDRSLADDASAIADLWLASRAEAMPHLSRVHSDDAVRAWIQDVVLQRNETWVARCEGRVVGFMSCLHEDLDQLYVLPEYYRRGIGTRLLSKAKQQSPRRLRLFTFQRNVRARAFYEAHGFSIVDMNDGSRNEEHEPDVLYEWCSKEPPAEG